MYNIATNDPYSLEARKYIGNRPNLEAKNKDNKKKVKKVKDKLVD